SLSSFELFFAISKILFLHRFYFQFESCFFSFPQKSQFFRDDYVKNLNLTQSQIIACYRFACHMAVKTDEGCK
ncbi:hypothetical protein U1O51_12985, partial [Leptospira interrogans]